MVFSRAYSTFPHNKVVILMLHADRAINNSYGLHIKRTLPELKSVASEEMERELYA